MRLIVAMICGLALSGCPSAEPTHWGDAVPVEGVRPLAQVVDVEAAGSASATVTVRGEVEEVCPHAGCWFVIRDGREQLYVDLEGGVHFTVPRSLEGHRVRVAGRVNRDGAEVRLIGTGVVIED